MSLEMVFWSLEESLGDVLGVSGADGDLFGSSWGVVVDSWLCFGLLGDPWCDCGCPWGPFGGLWGSFGGHVGAFGWPVAVFLVASVRKREIGKSCVLLMENAGFQGRRGAGGSYFGICLVVERVLGSFLGTGSYEIGYWRLEAGKWEAGGCQGEPRV